jgi:hypothetical protein
VVTAPQVVGGLLQDWQHRALVLIQELCECLVGYAERTPQMVDEPPQLQFPTVSLRDLTTADQRDRRGLGTAGDLGGRGFAQDRERSGFIEFREHRRGRLQPGHISFVALKLSGTVRRF